MTAIDWPAGLVPRRVAFNKRGMSIGGPVSLTGRTQVAQSDAGYWVAALGAIDATVPAKVKAFRAFTALLEGGATQVRVPVFDCVQRPLPAGVLVTETAFSDDTTFDDGTSFAEQLVVVALAAAAALRATTISVTVTTAGDIAGGEYFSLGDRLHVIREVISVSGVSQVWSIWPPLRAQAGVGETVNFDRPACLMRLVNEGDDDLALDYGRWASPDLSFVETF